MWEQLRRVDVRILLLVNSSASSVTARGRVVIQKALSADHEVRMVETNRRGHATRLSRAAANDGVEVVVVLGGDGTLNEAANGLAGTDTALAPLPGGSTNVFARTLGLPDDPVDANAVLLEALERGELDRVGLGVVNGRYFLFHVGIGYDAAVVAQVERRGTMKRWASHPLFAYCAVTTWFRHFDRTRPAMAVELPAVAPDGATLSGALEPGIDAFFTVVLNTNPYTYLGTRPFNLAPDATLDRGLAVVAIRTMQVGPFLRLVGSALGSGRLLRHSDHVVYRHDVDRLAITGHRPFPYQVDGDYLGERDRLEFQHAPDILTLVRPGSASLTAAD
jgi:diacylglycerol kinase family enzyme